MSKFKTARPDAEIEKAEQLGHGPFTEGEGSAGMTWICIPCESRIAMTGGVWRGWALEYSCAEICQLRNPTA